jgi:hypothetical protein
MATFYSAIPSGGLYDIPASLPLGLLYRYKKISNVSRQTMKFPPNNGQGDVWAGQVINVTLPPDALINAKINGQTRQLLNNYGLVYNILSDITSGSDAMVKNRIGQKCRPIM